MQPNKHERRVEGRVPKTVKIRLRAAAAAQDRPACDLVGDAVASYLEALEHADPPGQEAVR